MNFSSVTIVLPQFVFLPGTINPEDACPTFQDILKAKVKLVGLDIASNCHILFVYKGKLPSKKEIQQEYAKQLGPVALSPGVQWEWDHAKKIGPAYA